jgi:hypothetical protein
MSALRHFSIMHLPAITVTLTLLSLYIAKVRWDNPSTESLNALQFAAKGHETVLLMSLGDILLYRISYGLNRQDIGVPLGFLPSSLYLAAPFRYLVSRQLWIPTFKSGKNAKYRWATGAMIVSISVLCIAASPLSAITIIPRLDWWKDDEFNPFYERFIRDPPRKWIPSVEYRTRFDGESGPFLKNNIESSTIPRDTFISMGISTFGFGTEITNCTYTNYENPYSPISMKSQGVDIVSTTRPLSFVALSLNNA